MTEMTSSGGTSLPQTNPRTFGQILERLIELLKTRFRLLVGIAAVPALTLLALYVLLIGAMFLIGAWPHPADKADPEKMLWAVFPAMLLGSLPVMAVYALFEAAGSYAATRADLGVEVTVLEAYRFAWRPLGSRSLTQGWGRTGDEVREDRNQRRDVWQAARAFIAFDH